MAFTDDKYINIEPALDYEKTSKDQDIIKEKRLTINEEDPFLETDLGVIVHAFELNCQEWQEDDYSKAYMYKDVYNTQNYSNRVREQLSYYPGMHQINAIEEDPLKTNAEKMAKDRVNYWNNAMDNPSSFMGALKSRTAVDYSALLDPDTDPIERRKKAGEMLTKCIPCFDRKMLGDLLLPDMDLLEVHLLDIKVKTDILDKIKALFKDPNLMIDICELLKLFSSLCPSDLLAILNLLTQYLAKLNLEVKFNLNFIIELIGPILSPFLSSISAWLDKWIQLILGPLICVLDHINETIMLVQQAKIPFSEVTISTGLDTNLAGPMHKNMASSNEVGLSTGLDNSNKNIFEKDKSPYAQGWASYNIEAFNTPDREKYNPEIPNYPKEETRMHAEEISEAWKPSYTKEEREEKNRRWTELRQDRADKTNTIPPPLKMATRDGTRWSKDGIPESEKFSKGGSVGFNTLPPEKQGSIGKPSEYFVTGELVLSILELRNIMQGGIQYINDWFTYITQMIYDLLGTDIGWMSKKTDTTILKSKIIQLIYVIKAIIEAISKNGLKCGEDTNFDQQQMNYILEDAMNRILPSGQKFKVAPNGDILYKGVSLPKIKDKTNNETSNVSIPGDKIVTNVNTSSKNNEDVENYTTVRNCLKSVSKQDLNMVKDWIADFERRGGINE